MKLSDNIKQKIRDEYSQWFDKQYADKTLEERQEFGQFFTPPELTIQMIEKFDTLEGSVIDPCAGSGNLLAACIIAGADPKRIYYNEYDPEIYEIGKKRLADMGVPVENFVCSDALGSNFWDELKNRGVIEKKSFMQLFGKLN